MTDARQSAAPDAESRAAVAALVDDYAPRLRALGLRLCGNAADADDLVQDTFLQAYRRWSTLQNQTNPGPWLFTIAARACRRRSARRRATRMPAFSELAPFADTTVADLRENASPTRAAESAEARAAMESAIATLPAPFRFALVLKDILELPTDDVAEVLGVKPQTVKTRVHRARLLLRKALMRETPQRPAPAPVYERQVCLDLLKAKLEAMDKGRGFPVGRDVLCSRCNAVFAELDLTQNACADLAQDRISPELRRRILRAIDAPS